jgi:DNA-binding transcriptional MocR family regulator
MNGNVSEIYKRLKVGPMKRLYKYYTPTSINFAGGVPMDSIFPFNHVDLRLSASNEIVSIEGNMLKMNYLRGDGIPDLKAWFEHHIRDLHSPRIDFGTCVSVGSTDAFAKILTLLNGDSVIFDEYAYGASVNACSVFGRKPLGVAMDNLGMLPQSLSDSIQKSRSSGLNPDIVYLTPTGHNPTGITMPLSRKEELYEVCRRENMLIVEDGE